jgi:hypothetical protein
MLKKLSVLSVALVMVALLFVGFSTTSCKKKAAEAPMMMHEQMPAGQAPAQPTGEAAPAQPAGQPAQGAQQPAGGQQQK